MFPRIQWLCLFLLFFLLLGCTGKRAPKSVEQLYNHAMEEYDQGAYSSAITFFRQVIERNPGTRYATFAHLKLADALVAQGSSGKDDNEAELHYRIFLIQNSQSHMVPYVLSRLIFLSFQKNEHWFFGYYYDFNRDPEPFKKIIQEYQRFYLLYPNSLYLQAGKEVRDQSIEALAFHELSVGNWYFDHSLYPSSIARYIYLLRNYPNFSQSKDVVERLIEAYRRNQRPDLATEMERVYQLKFNPSSS